MLLWVTRVDQKGASYRHLGNRRVVINSNQITIQRCKPEGIIITTKLLLTQPSGLYQDLYQDEYETKFCGQYVVIEVLTKRAYVSETAAGALLKAKTDDPNGLFHLIEIHETVPKGFQSHMRIFLNFVRRLGDIKLS